MRYNGVHAWAIGRDLKERPAWLTEVGRMKVETVNDGRNAPLLTGDHCSCSS